MTADSSTITIFTRGFISYICGIAALIGIGFMAYLLAADIMHDEDRPHSGPNDVVCDSVLHAAAREAEFSDTCDALRQKHLGQAVLIAIPTTVLAATSINLPVAARR